MSFSSDGEAVLNRAFPQTIQIDEAEKSPQLLPNTYAYESQPMVKPTGFREYDARWIFEQEINLMGLNAIGLGIALGVLAFTHYVLDLTSPLADNISANIIGLGLGTAFRFWSYRRYVFVPGDPLAATLKDPV